MIRKYQKIFILLSLPVQVLLVRLLADKPHLVESFYTNTLYRYLSSFLRLVSGITPIPLGQILFYSLIAGCLLWLGRQLQMLLKRQVKGRLFLQNIFFGSLTVVSAFYFFFNFMWGLNYYRQPVQVLFNMEQKEVTDQELAELSAHLVQLTNESRSRVTQNEQQPLLLTGSKDFILENATAGFREVAKQYPALQYAYPSVKSVYVPQLMSVFGVGGIYFPFTGEANVNMDPPGFLLPATVCHEMAHQIGFASEDEANYVSYLACRLNPDPHFQYSGNLMAMRYTLNRLSRIDPEAFEKLWLQIDCGVMLDLEANRIYWSSFENPIEVVSSAFYDLFLKANDQQAGIQSYSRVVDLLIGEYRKNKLIF